MRGKSGNNVDVSSLLGNAVYTTKTVSCHGCENNCLVIRYAFADGKVFFSGNRCERVFSNGEKAAVKGRDAYSEKYRLLFDRASSPSEDDARLRIGIPRALGMYEDFPFWYALFTSCGFQVVLSDPSSMSRYESVARMVMSDNICFPAKLVHEHIDDLLKKGVDRIFFPFVVHGPKGSDQNSYNCPIVTGYSEVVKEAAPNMDSPVISMKNRDSFLGECVRYLATLGIGEKAASKAFDEAVKEQENFFRKAAAINREILRSRPEGRLAILLAGRPYHCDPLIQHNVSGMIASLGVDVLTDDIVRDENSGIDGVDFLPQWTYTNRILRSASWCARQGSGCQFVELTSFGCGPDAFLTDAVRDLLSRYGKSLTLLKLDDISNIGSMKLRVRSLVDSLEIGRRKNSAEFENRGARPYETTPSFTKSDRKRTIIVPFFTPFISPLLPSIMKQAGYKVVCLPESDRLSAETGLKYANNEVCYPATLVVGDIIKALKSGKYPASETAVAMTQTGGQCRASNYLSLIKKAMVDAGFGDVPVISVTFGSGISNNQPGFTVNWLKMIPIALYSVLFSDSLAKLYYPAAVRMSSIEEADSIKDKYLSQASDIIALGKCSDLLPLIGKAAAEFNSLSDDSPHKKVGIVGEIYLKFNPFAHHNLPRWLMERGVEISPPVLTDFFIQYFVNRKTNRRSGTEKGGVPEKVLDFLYRLLEKYVSKFNAECSAFRHYTPFNDIFEESRNASKIISLSAQFGEGWLLPGEIATYFMHGVKNVLSLQPFGCIANHIVVRGVEKRIKRLFPDINLLALDFDSGVSEVNVINRMLLFTGNLR